jgi:hypothetical protein
MCKNGGMKTTTEMRFWSHVNKTDSCWLWTGSKRYNGYGAFVWAEDGVVVQGRAHRYSWELVNGKIPDGLCCLHRCDVPACVNPSHLWLGTKADNNRDMCAKGRHVPGGTHCGAGQYRRGGLHWNARLTEAAVRGIRTDRINGASFSELASKYGVSKTAAFKVVKGKTWKRI